MMNQVILVGRIESFKNVTIDSNKMTQIKISITRSYKNDEGVYLNDIIPIILPENIGKNALEYCQEGDIVGIKGHMKSSISQKNLIFIECEKLTFLSSKKADKNDD